MHDFWDLKEIKAIYHHHLGRLTSHGMAQKAREGGYPGFAPTGYRNATRNGKRTVEIDPVLGPLVEEAFRRASQPRASLHRVLEELTPRGLVSRTGHPLYPAALRRILTNPFYAGMIRYQGQFYRGHHEPLVSPTLFERVQRRLRERRR